MLLIDKGYTCTQATLSRDLKFLKIAKIATNDGKYIYTTHVDKKNVKIQDSTSGFVSNGFIGLEFAQKLALIKTVPGYASSLAMLIDMSEPYEFAGTIAGDDTILIIPRDGTTESDIRHRLVLIFPELEDRVRP
jgi:transcriptional regulator of arginine metabolism